jgi:hypothetical protein
MTPRLDGWWCTRCHWPLDWLPVGRANHEAYWACECHWETATAVQDGVPACWVPWPPDAQEDTP